MIDFYKKGMDITQEEVVLAENETYSYNPYGGTGSVSCTYAAVDKSKKGQADSKSGKCAGDLSVKDNICVYAVVDRNDKRSGDDLIAENEVYEVGM